MRLATGMRPGLVVVLLWSALRVTASPAAAADVPADPQERAVRAVRDAGGVVVRDRDLPGHPVVTVRLTRWSDDPTLPTHIAAFGELRELEWQTAPLDDAAVRRLAGLRQLRKLSLGRTKLTDAGVAVVAANLPELQELAFGSRDVTDAGLKSLVALRKLRVLRPGCVTDGTGLAALAALPELHALDLTGVRTTPDTFRRLRGLPNLRELYLCCNSGVGDADLQQVADLPALEKLVLLTPGLTDRGLRALAKSRSLKSIRLLGYQVTGAGVAALRGLPTLEELHVLNVRAADVLPRAAELPSLTRTGSDRATDVSLRGLRALRRPQALGLAYSSVSDAGLKELRAMATLEELDLSSTGVTDAGMAELTGLTELKVLKLVNCRVGDAGMAPLRGLTHLRELELPGGVGDAGLDALSGLPELERLYMSCSEVGDVGVGKFERFRSLRSLTIGSAKLTDAGLATLGRLTNLRELDLWSSSGEPRTYSEAGYRRLQEALPYTEVRRR